MEKKVIKLLIVGSRSFTNYELLKKECFNILTPYINDNYEIIIVSGGANGADKLGRDFALENHFTYVEFPAKWEIFGRQAGFIRNTEMHKYISDVPERMCIAFWDGISKGTAQSFSIAKRYENPITIIKY